MVALALNPSLVATIDHEHDQLQEFVHRLHLRISGPPWHNSMVPSLLKSLVLHLEAHFQSEEASGIYDSLRSETRHLPPKFLEQLVHDHHRLLELANQLANRCYQGPRSLSQWQQIQEMYDDLQTELNEHEQREQVFLHGDSSGGEEGGRKDSLSPGRRRASVACNPTQEVQNE